ncbi:MAG: stage II sporulation protein M [Candidatus Nezhaarchaeales archaeon]
MNREPGPSGGLIPFLVLSAFLFASSAMAGYYVGLVSPEFSQALAELLGGPPGPLQQPGLKPGSLEFLWFILLNNGLKCLAAILLGPILGLFPLILVMVNGFILGALSVLVSEAYSPWLFLAAVIPHGVLEIPAVVLSVALGLRIGWISIKKVAGGKASLKAEVKRGLRLYLKVVLPLIVAAAFIETSLTPAVISSLIK